MPWTDVRNTENIQDNVIYTADLVQGFRLLFSCITGSCVMSLPYCVIAYICIVWFLPQSWIIDGHVPDWCLQTI